MTILLLLHNAGEYNYFLIITSIITYTERRIEKEFQKTFIEEM